MRYEVIPESNSGHCCFDASVVDTTRPLLIGGVQPKDDRGNPCHVTICECFDVADAERICMLLNEAHQPSGIVLNTPHAKETDVPGILRYLLSVLPAGATRDTIETALKGIVP